MTDAGARDPASPPKAPSAAATPLKPATPRAAPVAQPAKLGNTVGIATKVMPVAAPFKPRAQSSPEIPPVRPQAPSSPDAPPGALAPSPPAPAVGISAPAPAPAPGVALASAPAFAPSPSYAPSQAADLSAALVKVIVEDAVAPLRRAVVDLTRRVEELERRPGGASPPARSLPALTDDSAPILGDVTARYPVSAGGAPIIVPQTIGLVPVITQQQAQRGRLLSVAEIERTVGDIDAPFNGRRRQRLIAVSVILVLLAGVGAALAALAYNNSQPNVIPAPPSLSS